MNFYKLLKKQIKSNPITIIIFILIFYISTLGLSVLVSTVSGFTENTNEYYSMFDDYTTNGTIAYGDGRYDHKNFLKTISKIPEDTKLRTSYEIFKIEGLNDRKVVTTDYFKSDFNFTYPILEGRFYTKDESIKGEKVILLGKSIYLKYNKSIGDKINIDNEEFKIIGVVGYKDKKCTFDETVFMPLKSITKTTIKSYESIPYRDIYLSGKDSFKDEEVFKLGKELGETNPHVSIANISKVYKEKSGAIDSVLVYSGEIFIVSICILFALLNMVLINYFWIKDRRFEIGVRKAFGIKDRQICTLLVCEFLSVVLVSSILAIISQGVLSEIFKNIGNYSLELSIRNIIIIVLVNVLVSFLVSIIPITKAIKVSPIEIVRGE